MIPAGQRRPNAFEGTGKLAEKCSAGDYSNVASETPVQWEYLAIPEKDRDRLSELGLTGWELVAIGGSAEDQLLYLKRPAPNLRERATIEQRSRYYESLGFVPDRGGERGNR